MTAQTTELTYFLCWEDPSGDDAWVIRVGDASGEAADSLCWNTVLGERDELAAKNWAGRVLGEDHDVQVTGWRREGEFTPIWKAEIGE